MRKIFEVITGILMVLVGIVGLIMPIMPGWIFIIPGLALLARHFKSVQRLLAWARQKAESVLGRPAAGGEPQPPP